MPRKLSHYDQAGRASMVDVSAKVATRREAEATALVAMQPAVLKALPKNPKGDPLEVARLAGIMAAKRTAELIPMCHRSEEHTSELQSRQYLVCRLLLEKKKKKRKKLKTKQT